MAREYAIGKGGMAAASVVAIAMWVVSLVLQPVNLSPESAGICLPSPSEWGLPHFCSWLLEVLLMAAAVIGAYLLNHKYNFIKTTKPVLPAVLLLLLSGNAWLTNSVTGSLLICGINILCLAILFDVYGSSNATQELFVIATFLSLGVMEEYAFLPMIVAFLLGANAMKVLRFKEFIAFMLGLIAPYWVVIGLGIISLDSFKLPSLAPLFSDYSKAADIFFLMLDTGIVALTGLLIGMRVAIHLYAGNARVNSMNFTILMLGLVSIVCIIVDFNNMEAYLATLYFAVAVQLAQLCAIWSMRHEWLIPFSIGLLSVGFFIATILIE